MFHPEVWNFTPPHSTTQLSHFTGKSCGKLVTNIINSQPFNHFVSIALPDTLSVPDAISKSLTIDCDYYKVLSLPIHELVAEDFLKNFVNNGEVIALSINTRIDVDDCVSLASSKKLTLLLNKVAFEELGLEGKVALGAEKSKDRYYVTIDLNEKALKYGSKYYSRVMKCLSQHLDLKLDFIIAWEPPEIEMCPSSVAAYFDQKNYAVKLCQPKFYKQHAYGITVPFLRENDIGDVANWLGAACLSAQSDENTEFLSNHLNALEGKSYGQIAILRWYGFFSTRKVQKLFELLRSHSRTMENIPWCSLHVQGFDDSPTKFHGDQHFFFNNGDNLYTVFIESEDSCHIHSITSSVVKNKKKK